MVAWTALRYESVVYNYISVKEGAAEKDKNAPVLSELSLEKQIKERGLQLNVIFVDHLDWILL